MRQVGCSLVCADSAGAAGNVPTRSSNLPQSGALLNCQTVAADAFSDRGQTSSVLTVFCDFDSLSE